MNLLPRRNFLNCSTFSHFPPSISSSLPPDHDSLKTFDFSSRYKVKSHLTFFTSPFISHLPVATVNGPLVRTQQIAQFGTLANRDAEGEP